MKMCHPYLDWCHWLRIFFLSFLSFEGTPFEHGYSLRSNLCSQFVVVRQSGDTCMEIPLSVNSYFSLGFRTFFMLSFIWGRLHGSVFLFEWFRLFISLSMHKGTLHWGLWLGGRVFLGLAHESLIIQPRQSVRPSVSDKSSHTSSH